MFVKPLQVLGTLTGLRAMGAALRSRFYMNMIARPTGDVNTIRNLERAIGVVNGFATRSIAQGVDNITEEQEKTVGRRVQNIREGRLPRSSFGEVPIDSSTRPPLPMPTFNQQKPITASSVERERLTRQLMGLENR